MRDYGEAQATRLIAEALEEAGMTREELLRLRKSDARKVQIARRVRAETTVPLRWLAKELAMGTAMNVSRLTAY
jgi:putative transposase